MHTIIRTTLLSLLFMAGTSLSRADQFVLFDVTFPFTKADADNAKPSQSHYYVKGDKLYAKRPKDWTAPVDYRNGTVHVRLEVIEKPAGSQPAIWNVCYIPNKGKNHGYGCIGTDVYKETGVYEKDLDMTKFWQNNDIIWSEGIKEMHRVLKDDHNLHAHKRPDPEKFFPTKIRMTLIQVSKGAKYDPKLMPNLPPAAPAPTRTLTNEGFSFTLGTGWNLSERKDTTNCVAVRSDADGTRLGELSVVSLEGTAEKEAAGMAKSPARNENGIMTLKEESDFDTTGGLKGKLVILKLNLAVSGYGPPAYFCSAYFPARSESSVSLKLLSGISEHDQLIEEFLKIAKSAALAKK